MGPNILGSIRRRKLSVSSPPSPTYRTYPPTYPPGRKPGRAPASVPRPVKIKTRNHPPHSPSPLPNTLSKHDKITLVTKKNGTPFQADGANDVGCGAFCRGSAFEKDKKSVRLRRALKNIDSYSCIWVRVIVMNCSSLRIIRRTPNKSQMRKKVSSISRSEYSNPGLSFRRNKYVKQVIEEKKRFPR